MPIIKINGEEREVTDNQNLIQAAAELGIFIPHYCFHPGLSIDGNCRMCLIEVATPRGPLAQIACNTFVKDGLEVYTNTENVAKMRQGVLEFLLLNHPIDCPICDQAGECKLQDFYMQYGLYSNRSTVPKVHKQKVVPIGPLVVLDQERCILCSRCVRFCDEISHSHELVITGRGENCRIETFPGQHLDNPYSGNVVDICPVGALTSKDFRFKKRVWFLSHIQSICTGCARGCNIEMDYAQNTVYRYRPRYHPDVNQYWLCDEGRLSYKHIHENRLEYALIHGERATYKTVMKQAQLAIESTIKRYGKRAIGALASATSTLEDNFILREMMDQVLDTNELWGATYIPDGEADAFLRLADKTPNRKGLAFLGISDHKERFEKAIESGTIKCLLVLDNNCQSEKLARLLKERVQIIIFLGTHVTPIAQSASFSLPITVHAEHDGSYVNANSLLQKVSRAYHPKTEAQPGWTVMRQLFDPFLPDGIPVYQEVEDVWGSLRKSFSEFSDYTFYDIPDTGVQLRERL